MIEYASEAKFFIVEKFFFNLRSAISKILASALSISSKASEDSH